MRRLALTGFVASVISFAPRAASAQAMAPLQLYFHAGRGDNYVTATAEGRTAATRAGYRQIRSEGCIYTALQPGTTPLYQYYSSDRGDNMTTTSVFGAKGADNPGGYVQVRIEGYVLTAEGKSTAPLNLFYNARRRDHFATATTAGADAARAAGYTLVGVIGHVMPASNCQ